MPTPVVVDALRTPQGEEDGVYEDVRSEDLSAPILTSSVTGIAACQPDTP